MSTANINQYFNEISYDSSKLEKNMTNEELILNNLKLVIKLAHKYKKFAPLDDLIQEGNIGLIDAVSRRDKTRLNKFGTYAAFYIKDRMWKFMRNNYPVKNGIGKTTIIYMDKKTSYEPNTFNQWDKIYKLSSNINNNSNMMNPYDLLIHNENIEKLPLAINKLSPIEKNIIQSRFGEKKCQLRKLAKKWKCTIPNIHITEKKALKKLKKRLS